MRGLLGMALAATVGYAPWWWLPLYGPAAYPRARRGRSGVPAARRAARRWRHQARRG